MRKFICLTCILLSGLVIFGQKSSLKGSVADTTDRKNLQYTVISLLRTSDSVLAKFTRADKSGNFAMEGVDEGKYIIMVTHPYVGDYFDQVELKAGIPTDLGRVIMIPKSKLLAEVILKSGSPIRIKGDTTVYTADSFKVRAGANVEELLRRLPGIQVDKNGTITAMGERVTKVLVDGEEFFGSDPGIATKNLRADVVKEVEVFDKKSDQAEFTGIDDGVKDKTINLKLKEDKKKGYFGKIEVGGGLKDKFSNSMMLNAFKGKRKLAGYGIMSNTGQTNLDWQDAQNYGGGMDGMNMEMNDDGGMMIFFDGGGDDNFRGGRNGVPTNWNGGLHYSNKYNNNKNNLNAGYKFSKVNAPGITTTFARNFWPDSSWNTNTINNRFTSTIKHGFNLTLESNLDTMNSLKWTTKVNNNTSRTSNNFYSESLTEEGDSINNSRRTSNNASDNNSVASTLLWKHKFKKLSRTLSVNTDLNWSQSKNDGLLYSLNSFYKGGVINRRDTMDQQNINNRENKSIVTKLSYTEPLIKDTYLELSYSFGYYNNDNERITNAGDGNGKYEERIDSLSNAFIFNRLVHTPGVNFRVNKKKYNYSFGLSTGFSHFIQKNVTEDLEYKYNFTNYFPRATLQYKFKPSQNLRLNYNGNTTAPSLEQLQPIRVNTDPFNIYIGNPDLKQSFRHSFNVGYSSYNVLKEKNIWTNLSYTFTQNAFSQFSSVDTNGVRTYQTVNVDGVYSVNFYGDYGFKIPDTKWRLGFGPNLNHNRNIDFVRDPKTNLAVKNSTVTTGYGVRLNVNQYVENKYNFYFNPNFSWNTSKASVSTNANAEYWMVQGWFGGEATLPKNFQVGTDANFQVREKDPRFPANNSFMTWNANVVKRFFKNELDLKFAVYDILNQNRGYQRNFNSFSFTETYYNTLKRFWQVSLTWNISKNGKPAQF
ncbi:MAG: outer membrane beta-barrel protein [Chitinophagaceae bacterium]|nr:outer membrane beta-barrel protein [Chitinophagaceae bacterium]